MRSPRLEFRPARDARYHRIPGGLPTPVPAPLRRTNDEDDDAQYILAQYTYTMPSTPFLEICTSVLRHVLSKSSFVINKASSSVLLCLNLRHDVHFGVLALASSVEFRWKTVETVTSWHL